MSLKNQEGATQSQLAIKEAISTTREGNPQLAKFARTLLTLNEAVAALGRQRETLEETIAFAEAAESRAEHVEIDLKRTTDRLQLATKRVADLEDEIATTQKAESTEVAKIRGDLEFLLEILGISKLEWQVIRTHWDRLRLIRDHINDGRKVPVLDKPAR